MTKLEQIEEVTKEVVLDSYNNRVDAVTEVIHLLGLEYEIHYETDCGDGDQSAWKIHIEDNTSLEIAKVVNVLSEVKNIDELLD